MIYRLFSESFWSLKLITLTYLAFPASIRVLNPITSSCWSGSKGKIPFSMSAPTTPPPPPTHTPFHMIISWLYQSAWCFPFMWFQCLRPTIPQNTQPKLAELLEKTWKQDPALRPDFSEIIEILQQIAKEVFRNF